MSTIIKKGASKETIDKSLQKLSQRSSKKFNANQFCGILKIDDDALDIQKKLRSEWK